MFKSTVIFCLTKLKVSFNKSIDERRTWWLHGRTISVGESLSALVEIQFIGVFCATMLSTPSISLCLQTLTKRNIRSPRIQESRRTSPLMVAERQFRGRQVCLCVLMASNAKDGIKYQRQCNTSISSIFSSYLLSLH